MEKLKNQQETPSKHLKSSCSTLLVILFMFLMAEFIETDEPKIVIPIYFFVSLFSLFLIGAIIVQYAELFRKIIITFFIIAIILLCGGCIVHFFVSMGMALSIIFNWPAILGIFILLILTITIIGVRKNKFQES